MGRPLKQSGITMNAQIAVRMLLDWYDRQGRDLPWRHSQDPYRIWLSEIMLQQTTVAVVIPYYQAFLKRWPKIGDLAAADLDDVLALWQGLGYYARARNLHDCARIIQEQYAGIFPADEKALRALPGIGEYTAAALAAIAFNQPATVIDGNIIRVLARWWGISEPLPDLKKCLKPLARTCTPAQRPGDYAQALMDLGAMLCKPHNPDCPQCPIQSFCVGYENGQADSLPIRAPRRQKPRRFGTVFWITDPEGRVYLRRRPTRGLLGGMMEFPGSIWGATPLSSRQALSQALLPLDWCLVKGHVRHSFTHFHLELSVFRGSCPAPQVRSLDAGRWVHPRNFDRQPLPTLMRKVARLVLDP